MRNGLVTAEGRRRLDDLRQQAMQRLDLDVDPGKLGALQRRRGDRLAERRARDALDFDSESAAEQWELVMIGVEPEAFATVIVVTQRDQAFAADVEAEPRFRERPSRRKLRPHRKSPHALALGPGRADSDWSAVERPTDDLCARPDSPSVQFGNALAQTFPS